PDSGAETFDYHVIRGDTLSGIAWRVYGDASLWPQIAQDNAAQITNPAQIRPGQVLVIIPHRR
ncbi:MAG: LysM peptidoglycan-binding domain-containing protein, partial [Candidatus Thiodiazotropha sp. 6PLUC4]